MKPVPRIVVFASGEGTNFQAIIDSVKFGHLKAEIISLFTNRRGCRSVQRAVENGITTEILDWRWEMEHAYSGLLDALKRASPDLIVLAGFMRILPPAVIELYPMKIINTHPSLLPCFGGHDQFGDNVHRSVIESGARFTGCTVHFVTNDIDKGPIILQSVVPVSDEDSVESLSSKVKNVEHETLVRAISIILSGNYSIAGNRVKTIYA